MSFISNYLVPIVGGVFILLFISFFGYLIYATILKPLGVMGMIKKLILSRRRKKILADEKIIEYCVTRIGKGWNKSKVHEELLLANKYSKQRIDEMLYAFEIIQKEMQPGKKVAEDLP